MSCIRSDKITILSCLFISEVSFMPFVLTMCSVKRVFILSWFCVACVCTDLSLYEDICKTGCLPFLTF